MGQLLATGILTALLKRTDEWAYRIPFALQWMWPVPLIIGCLFAPESPWWHVRKGNVEAAKHPLRKLTSANYAVETGFSIDNNVAMMVHTNELERLSASGMSYWQCFKGVNVRHTEIVSLVWVIQTFCGSGLMGFSIYFFTAAGLTPKGAFDFSIGQYALGAVGTRSSW